MVVTFGSPQFHPCPQPCSKRREAPCSPVWKLRHLWHPASSAAFELTSRAKDRLNDVSERAGMTQVAMLSRLVEWFANQPEIIHAAVRPLSA